MAKLSSIPPAKYQRVLVYGPPKTGKTELLTTLASEFNLMYIGCENGHATLQKLPPELQDKIEVINLPDTRDHPIAAETMLKLAKGDEYKVCQMHGKINCMDCMKASRPIDTVHLNKLGPDWVVAWDSMTQFTTSLIAHITKAQDELYKLDYDDWGNLGKLVDIYLNRIQQGQFHSVVISHETEAEMEDGKKRIVPVAGTRNASRNAARYFDHVVYAQVENGKHVFTSSTTGARGVVTGSRTNVAMEKMAVPSLLDIMKGNIKTQATPTPNAMAIGGLKDLSKQLTPMQMNPLNNPLNAKK